MTKESEIIDLCLRYNGAYQDFPFRSNLDYSVIRHSLGKKIFALVFTKDNKTWVNLKCEPMFGDFLKQVHSAVVPAFHMNKQHWISIILDDSIADDEIALFVSNSYELTRKKIKKHKIQD